MHRCIVYSRPGVRGGGVARAVRRHVTGGRQLHERLLPDPGHWDFVARRRLLGQEHTRVVPAHGAAVLPSGGRLAGDAQSLRLHKGACNWVVVVVVVGSEKLCDALDYGRQTNRWVVIEFAPR